MEKQIMKRILLLSVICSFTIGNLIAQQTSWQWVNPLPQGNVLNSVYAIDKDTVYGVASNGTIIKTTNGGRTWQVTPNVAGVTEALYAIRFSSNSIGWVVGEFGRILKTTDAGRTWFIQYAPTTMDLFGMEFISSTTGWIIGTQGIIFKTTNGGDSWIPQNSGITATLYGIYFQNSTTCWVVGTDGKIISSTDGGTTWLSKTSGTIQNLYSIQFISPSLGYAVGAFGLIIRSTNGGETWLPQASGVDFSLYGLQFPTALIGYATGSFGSMIKTTNGGYSWFVQSSRTYNDLYGIHFASSTTGWAVGDYGTILNTTDGGTNWTHQSNGVKNLLNGISFSSPSHGVAVGEEGTIIRTIDGGGSWSEQSSGVLQILYGVHMINDDVGWIVGDSSVILRTTNGGTTWIEQNGHNELSLYSVFFVNTSNGWAVGDFGSILATINGGYSWHPETSNVYVPLTRIKFLNTSIGWAVGFSGEILKTNDGGHNWEQQISNTYQTLYSLAIIDENTVYATGDFGTVVVTTDGGATWQEYTADGWESFYGSAFLDRTTGWACGDDGVIYKTTDACSTWTTQNSGTYNTLWDMQLIKSTSGGGTLFAAGVGGTLICSGVSPMPFRLWTGTYDASWTSAGNWNPVGVPDKGDSVYIPVTTNNPELLSLIQQVNLGSLRIGAGAKLTIGSGPAQLVVSGNIKIDGILDIHPSSTLEIIAGDNFALGTNGILNPAQSTIAIINNGQLRGSFFNLIIANGANVQSNGNVEIRNNLTIHTDISLRQQDTLSILNPEPQGFQGIGFVNKGTIRRSIRQGGTYDYRFESPITYIKFHPTGTMPDAVLMTAYPNTRGSGLSDAIFVKRYYSISAIGGNDYLSLLSLRYDTSETQIPIDDLGFFRDSSDILFNMGVTDYLDSDIVAINLDSVSKFSKWYIGKKDYIWKHPQQFMDSLIISDHGSGIDTIVFGIAPGATDGIDPYLGESQLPPKPSAGTFDTRWVIPGTNGTNVNIRDILDFSHQQVIYTGTFQPGSGGYPFTLRWNNMLFPFGTATLRDAATQGGQFSVNMRYQNSYVITNPSIASFEIVYQSPTFYSYNQGWNMIAVPVLFWGDNHKTTIFPTSISSAFRYSNLYIEEDMLTHGIGYWLKFAAPEVVSINGNPIFDETIQVNEGWNLIGSISTPIVTSNILQSPSNIIQSDFFSYDLSYNPTDTIYPAKAYWIKTNQPGQLVLLSSIVTNKQANIRNHEYELGQFNTITVSDKDGYKQVLYFGDETNVSISKERYELPPQPPDGIFDVRFTSNNMVELWPVESKFLTIKLQSSAYPITINWKIKQPSLQSLSLIDANTGKRLHQSTAQGDNSLQISDSSIKSIIIKAEGSKIIPKEFVLKQNYPNPFNPSTVIEYALPVDAQVTVKIYNLLGQEVASLLDSKPMEAGLHQIEFNPSNLIKGNGNSSGVYLYRISARSDQKNFLDVKKMLFLK